MKLTKKLEAQILKDYHALWEANLRGDINTFASFLDNNVTVYGTAAGEIFKTKKEAVKFYKATADQMTGKADFRKRKIGIKAIGDTIVINEQCDLYVFAEAAWVFYGHARVTAIFEQKGNSWKVVHMHGSFPDSRTGEGEQLNTDKIKEENIQLRDAVRRRTEELENKNRELEIETALEKVRTVAMGMKEPADMPEVCKTISLQLQSLGVNEIRNVQTAIFYESRGTYMNYEYYAKHRKTIITETVYTNHKIASGFAKKMLQGKGEIFITHIKGKKVKEWLAYQETTNVFIDRFLEKAASLNYYWHSLGPVALGISTYAPLTKEELSLFNRFLNVFELAYTRYLDIEQAIAQAKEAKIEASLERVRAVAMGMKKPDDLLSICEILFKELLALGFSELRNALIHTFVDEKNYFVDYDFSEFTGGRISRIPYNSLPFIKKYLKEIRKSIDAFTEIELSGKELEEWKAFRKTSGQTDDPRLDSASALYYYNYSIGVGDVGISTFHPITHEKREILKRFRNVFDLAYRRYIDIQQAEAQAREAQIEAALERVRSRSMGMQKSEELKDVIKIVYQQLIHLKINLDHAGFVVDYKPKGDWTFWIADEQDIPSKITHPYFESVWANQFNEAKETGADFFVTHLNFEEKNKFYRQLLSYVPGLPETARDFYLNCPALAATTVLFKDVSLYMENFSGIPYSNEENKILMRLGKVFEQTYTRFKDLEKAEAQAREAKIEAALEKVRSRTMAMQKSEELSETSFVLFQQLKELGEDSDQITIGVLDEDKPVITLYATTHGNQWTRGARIELAKHSVYQQMYSGWKKNLKSLLIDVHGKELEALNKFKLENPDYQVSADDLPKDRWLIYNAFFSNGSMSIGTTTPRSDESIQLLERFAQVFDHTYTRFLDLQKAEAQAREVQIQLALERVRARTMAMHKSDELPETSHILFEQMKELGEPVEQLTIGIVNEENNVIEISATLLGDTLKKIYCHSIDEPYMMAKIYKAWKKQQKTLVVELRGDELNAYNQYRNELTNSNIFPTNLGKEHQRIVYAAFFSKGMLALGANETRPPESLQLLVKFASVFDLTYTRFLDLQKAEAQAREAQIEASLERVRARTMAMHNSEDVSVAAATMFSELEKLGIENFRGGILNIKGNKTMDVWSVNRSADSDPNDPEGGGKTIRAAGQWDMTLHPWWRQLYDGWVNKEELLHYFLTGKEKEDYVKILDARRDYIPGGVRELPDCHIQGYYFGEGAVWTFSLHPHSDEDKQVMKKFAAVFSLTFRRYQDLKKAEAQAREATIEAALEKVRGRAMAMHDSSDLSATASIIFTELRKLGINPIRCGVGLLNKESRKAQLYSATSSAGGDNLSLVGWIMLSNHPVAEKIYDTWLSNEDYYPELSGEQLKSYYENLLSGLSLPSVPDWQSGQKQYGTFIPFSVGCFYAWSETPYNETEIKIVKRFGSIIDLTFRRYIELQKSEANAREAIKQAALDRIRADIASMRTIGDLDRITPLIWNELTILGIPFIRCGVFIMDNSQQLIHTFLSTPDGKAIAAFHLPYDTPGNLSNVLSHWNDHQNYIDHWDESAFTDLAAVLVKQGAIATPAQYLNTIPHGGFYLHFLPFLQGMLYVGNTVQLKDEDIHLIQSVADAFSTAYARYEDFNKLEAAKQQVDKTLVELKQAQTQLVQSEKMASLGELTAGIAHEIQNPLNFVNNFSEVSTELLDEMITELEKGNQEDAVAIADDVKQNLEKILHHGKRADGIVKGMLQHSRSSTAVKEPTDINKLADEYLRLAYHGLRAKDKSFNVTLKTDFDESIGNINVIPQDIGRAVLNLITNAFYVVGEKRKQAGDSYEPTVSVTTKKAGDKLEIRVADNGDGIPSKSIGQNISTLLYHQTYRSGNRVGSIVEL